MCLGGLPDHTGGKGRNQARKTGGRRALHALIADALHRLLILTLLLAVVGCSQAVDGFGEDTAAALPSTVRIGPLPQFSAEYEAPFRRFAHCATRALARKQTIRLAYDDQAGLARLVAYSNVLDGRLVYELNLWPLPDEKVLAEMRVGPVSSLRNWSGEVDRALEVCQSEMQGRHTPNAF